ncbi:MAG: alpha/beta hydrolase, partial [Verrucomicrobia bacterium]|nr:alpha/beta hydrolase [Verrucomicrobiota bacterium]
MPNESFEKLPVDGAKLAYRRIGAGKPLVVLNGFAATSADWDPTFVDRLASSNELILLDNRGIGHSTDNGDPFDIAKLADDVVQVVETLGIERVNILGWSMGGFIAQAIVSQYPDRVNKLILLSTDAGGADADLPSPLVRSQLIDMSGTPHEQARRLLSLLFPVDVAESIYREFGDVVATARAQLSPDLVNRQAAAMDAWHRTGIGTRLREINVPVLIATGTADVVIPSSNALKLVNAISGAWLAQFNGGGHAFMAQYPRPLAD